MRSQGIVATGGLLVASLTLITLGVLDAQNPDGAMEVHADRIAMATEVDRVEPVERSELIEALNGTFTSLVKQVQPAVVRIEVRSEGSTTTQRAPQLQMPEPFRRFFEIPELEQGPQSPMPRVGGGSGFLISEDGYIVTNAHVVDGADEITVWLHDRRSFDAELIGSDPTTDVALIRIEGDRLRTLHWGSSDDLRVGEWVVAIGNPGVGGGRPLDYTVTSGIVSAKERPLQVIGRSLERDEGYGPAGAGYAIENFIQTDAVINPGNSGGPMVDLYGRVVGINSAIASTSGYYQGYGFAVPADLARRVIEDLMDDGRLDRAWLGVMVTGVTSEDAELYGLDAVAGVLVQSVTEGSPAEDAGLQAEDVIIGLDGELVDRGGGLQQLVAERRPGDDVTLSIVRDGKEREVKVELKPSPVGSTETASSSAPSGSALFERLGMSVEEVSADRADELGFDDRSVIVRDVDPFGPAARRGVTRGWRVVELNRTKIDSVDDVQDAVADVREGDIVRILLEAPDGTRRVANVRAGSS